MSNGNFISISHDFEAGETARFLTPSCHSVAIKNSSAPVDVDFYQEDFRLAGKSNGMNTGDSGGPSTSSFFNWLEIKSAVAQTVDFAAFGGNFSVSRIAGEVDVTVGNAFVGLGKIQLTSSVPAAVAQNSSRKELWVVADENNLSPIFLGATALNQGVPLFAGQTTIITCSGQIDLFSSSNAACFLAEVLK